MKQRAIKKSIFDPVRVHTWGDIKRAGAQCLAHCCITRNVLGYQVVDDVQSRNATGDFGGMNIRVDPMRWLGVVFPGC
jgi:hypothetical protein